MQSSKMCPQLIGYKAPTAVQPESRDVDLWRDTTFFVNKGNDAFCFRAGKKYQVWIRLRNLNKPEMSYLTRFTRMARKSHDFFRMVTYLCTAIARRLDDNTWERFTVCANCKYLYQAVRLWCYATSDIVAGCSRYESTVLGMPYLIEECYAPESCTLQYQHCQQEQDVNTQQEPGTGQVAGRNFEARIFYLSHLCVWLRLVSRDSSD